MLANIYGYIHIYSGEREKFRKVFEEPIMAGRQPAATEKDKVRLHLLIVSDWILTAMILDFGRRSI